MKYFEMLFNGEVIVPLNVESSSYKEEKNQLLQQEFTVLGETIWAEDGNDAVEKFQTRNKEFHDDIKFGSYAAVVAGVVNLIS
jgi:hypothetical protein